ncbi:PEP-CTERM sorting domain-containing protein, partial [Altererythrobacter sp. SALINAS58]|uniref:PEPxxWA-CTERM sorting domain-containing protein n=1 Tax=Alteripontixanthobacter muriae TaxID=2705546 RepID=UPI001575B977
GVGFSAGSDSFSHITFFNTGSTPAVPEPTTWAMMLFGFGAIGFAMRRRKDKTVTRRLHVSYN